MDVWIFNGSFKFRRNFVNIYEISSNIVKMSSKFRQTNLKSHKMSLIFRRNFVEMSGFRVSQQGASVWWLPAALRRPQKKQAPGFVEHVPCVFWRFWLLLAWCAQSACLRRFGDLRKSTPLEFWSMCLVDFVMFNDFRAPQTLCGCVAAACGASAPSEKTHSWIVGACIL